MKINKLQGGGYATYTPIMSPPIQLANGVSPQQTSSGQEGEGELLSKDVVKQLLENGLMNDVDVYVKSLSGLTQSLMTNPRAASQSMLNQYPRINRIIQNKELLTNAIKRADQNGGLGEFAITTTGQLIATNEDGDLVQITPEELKDNPTEYRPITNSELASMRQTNPNMAFNTSVFEIIGNGVGPDQITDYLLKTASKIGYDKMTSEGFISRKDENIAEGIETLLSGTDPEGVFKVTQSESSQTQKAQQALKYLYSVLPQNMRNYLKAQAASQGADPTTGAYEIIATLISSTLNNETSTSLDYDSAQTKAVGGDSGSNKDLTLNQSELILNQEGADRVFQLNPGTNYNFFMNMKHYQTPASKTSNLPIGKSMRLDTLFTESSLAGLVDTGAVYFGNQKVDEGVFDRVVYDNAGGGFGTVLLPFRVEDGHNVVDFTALEGLSNAQKEIKDKGITTDLEKQEIYDRYGVSQWYGIDKDPNLARRQGLLRPFIVFTGLSTDDDNVMSPDDPFVRVLPSQEKDNAKRKFLQAINEPATKGGKPGKYDVNDTLALFWDRNDILTSTVYVPLTDDYVTQFAANKNFKMPQIYGDEISARAQSLQQSYTPTIVGLDALN